MRCLVIDDNLEDRFLVERMLRRYGYRPTCVSSGSAAIAAMGEARYDVALVDLEMPGMTGAEAIRAMRTLDDRMRVLVVSGCDDREHILEALDAGADGYVLKDELGDHLQQSLQAVFAGKSALSAGAATVVVRHLTGRLTRRNERPAPPKKPLAERSGELIIGSVDLPKAGSS